MSTIKCDGKEAHDAGRMFWDSKSGEKKWGKRSAAINKPAGTASVDIGASLKVNASAQVLFSIMTWSLTGLTMQSSGFSRTCLGQEVKANASTNIVTEIKNLLTAVKHLFTISQNTQSGVNENINGVENNTSQINNSN